MCATYLPGTQDPMTSGTDADLGYLAEHIHQALIADERVTALDIEVRPRGGSIVLLGTVDDNARHLAAEVVARSLANGHEIINELQVVTFDGSSSEPSAASIRVAAVGDIHLGPESKGRLRPHLDALHRSADVLLIAGDLTRHGTEEEASVLAGELDGLPIPVVLVLGNHDYQSNEEGLITKVLASAGVTVLEGSSTTLPVGDATVGIAGVKGFGHGFPGATAADFGEPIMKAFVQTARDAAEALQRELANLDADVRIALTHYAPVEDTLRGENPAIYPFLGSYFLAEAIDAADCDMAFHGHAHAGTEIGQTVGGVPVRNVARPVIGRPYKIYCIEPSVALAGITERPA